MQLLRYTLLLMMLFASNAIAGDKRSVTLTNEQAAGLLCALSAPKGADRQPACANVEFYIDVMKEGDREREVTRRYQYKPGVTSAMAKDILILRPIVEKAEAARSLLQEKLITSSGQTGAESQAALTEFQRQVRELFATEHTLDLFTFSEAELDFAKNPWPASLQAVFDPIRE